MEREYVEGLVSVVIPCYNVAPYIMRCLNSIVNNTYKKVEIICVDDGSTDNTLDELRSVDDERITIISQENQGVSAARNAGLECAHGEYISFVDPDDWIHKDFFQRLVDIQKSTDADVVMCDYLRVENFVDDEIISDPMSPVLYGVLDVWNKTSFKNYIWRKLYKRSYVADSMFMKGVKISEDMMFNIDTVIANPKAKYAVTNDKLLYYYNRPNSLVRSFTGEELLSIVDGVSKAISRSDAELVVIPAIETVKFGLSARYLSMFEPGYKEVKTKCASYFKLALKNIKGSVSTVEYIKYSLFVRFPFLYRYFRILTDRTMRDWERCQKQKYSVR